MVHFLQGYSLKYHLNLQFTYNLSSEFVILIRTYYIIYYYLLYTDKKRNSCDKGRFLEHFIKEFAGTN